MNPALIAHSIQHVSIIKTITYSSQGTVIVPSTASNFSPQVGEVGSNVQEEDVLQIQIPNNGVATNQVDPLCIELIYCSTVRYSI